MKSLFLIFCLFPSLFFSQITITNGNSISNIVNNLIGSNSSVTVSNITYRGVLNVSSKYQIGEFTTTGTVQTNLGFASGLILSTGHTSDVKLTSMTANPRASQTSTGFTSTCSNGEVRQTGTCPTIINDVDVLAGSTNYYNASILEFDFIPSNSNISFRYVFGSDEYEDNSGFINYNCTSYNDKFGFVISGPGISGGQGYTNNGKNIARLTNGSEVSINSVNNGHAGSSTSYCSSVNPSWVNNTATAEYNGAINGICFNGNTKVLTASQSGLTPGETYHIKLIVTDLNDGAYDSGVFIEAGSFTSPVLLPVQLVSFDVNCNDKNSVLSWISESERNNDYYIIEGGNEHFEFSEIVRVQGVENTNNKSFYQFLDDVSNIKPKYYRLTQVDLNGKQRVLSVQPNDFSCEEIDESLNAYYDVISQKLVLNFQFKSNVISTLKVYNNLGQNVFVEKLRFEKNESSKLIDINQKLTQGIYFVSLENESDRFSSKIFITN